ncbi:beta-phosphoglucomutase [Halalkalibacter krulwichiae]|uniref:Beta-phosphoglucomutase n=1 Tax=Halalkalibacter krulwichiae TaxID=199441 RepID=A0A1X9MH87_9BACI|nr:beta-phosphoglucomutase [Halalkalibacter krulwichiae]ARK32827.1 Beta-phosphoglucomutase [Halalkalibacter krulwichiae]
MKQIKVVIFDMDGVISNTVPLHFETNSRLAKQLGVDFTEEWNQSLQGLSRRKTVDAMIKRCGRTYKEQEIADICEEKNKHYQQLISKLTAEDAQPGIRAFIQQLANRNIPMVIASASQNAELVLTQLQLIDYFQDVVDVTKLKKGKPDPEIFLKAAELAGADPSECVAIEDGEPGLSAILQTEMFSVGVGHEPFLKQADLYLDSTLKLTVEALERALNERQLVLK